MLQEPIADCETANWRNLGTLIRPHMGINVAPPVNTMQNVNRANRKAAEE
ncbi:hypothetical protein RvY_15704 [Ramazzottius varieornatus]|uniref:Uncharacterized protein n=1 Tax=Ramazzottius varieornatus TaxID=947166 RepID=A0A1D1VVW3_RAMVA|nr:hypothetical protein RvY_15704 [Ramazzottius varieornatus]